VADLRGQRSVVWAAPVVLVVAVVAAVFLTGGDDDAPGDGGAAATSSSTTPSPVAPTTKVDPDTWCTAFLAFADAQAQYVGAPDDPSAQAALQDKADALLEIGQPLGLSPGGVTSLQVLVDGALNQAGDPTLEPGPAPEDSKALADYLGASCPA
jgi:hypothetical protein